MRTTLSGIVLLGAVAIARGAAADDSEAQRKYDACIVPYKARQFDVASKCFEELVAASPASGNGFFYLARIKWAQGNLAGARAAYEKVLALNPSDRDALDDLTTIQEKLGDSDGALRTAQSGDRQYPRYLAFKVHLIQLYQRKNDNSKVEEVRRQLFELVNKQGVTDGLESKKLYVRETFKIGEVSFYGIEYFSSEQEKGPKYSLTFKRSNGAETKYRLEYHAEMNKIAEQLGEKAKGGPPDYYLDVYEEAIHRTAGVFQGDPGYARVRDLAVTDFKKTH
jgi:tetratricopeptide (TPR) repeat protein